MRLAKTILVRLLFGVLSLLFISFVVFIADELAPGDAATIQLGDKATPEKLARTRADLGLDRPWPVRYIEFVGKASHLDFGKSYFGTREEVWTTIGRTLPMTVRIAIFAILLASAVGILLGTIAGIYQNRFADRSVLVVSTLGVTLPNFVLIPVLVLIFAVYLNYLPTTWEVTRVAPDFYYLLLPVIVLAARPMATLTRLTRASMIDTLDQEFIRLAVAKGVPSFRLYVRHALRNAILPVVTAIGTSFGFLLTGSFVVETAFTLPGLGYTTINAIQQGDTPLIEATVIITGALFIVVNLLVDLTLPFLDPRIRESQV